MNTESTIDFPKDSLCPEIWEKVVDVNGMHEIWKLKADVKQQILEFISQLLEIAKLPQASKVHITGSITSNSYTQNADVDIHFLDFHVREIVKMTQKRLTSAMKQLKTNQSLVMIGTHPIEVYYQTNEFQDYMSVGCYDLYNDRWEVGPELTDQSFNPYSAYYKDIQKYSEEHAKQIRNMIFSIYELAIILQKNIGNDFANTIRPVLLNNLSKVQALYDKLRNLRKAFSSPKSKEEALKNRVDRKWKIADSSFKLFDKYGYTAIMKQLIEDYKLLANSSDVDQEVVDDILTTVKNYINNADKLSEQEIYNEAEQIDEGTKELVASAALAFSLLCPGLLPGKTMNYAKDLNKDSVEFKQRQDYFDKAFIGIDLNTKFGDFTFFQAANILAATYFGEGRGEIKMGALEPIIDTTVNRAEHDVSKVPLVCIAKRETSEYFQYSFWNKNTNALAQIKKGIVVIPAVVKDNKIEENAWDVCLRRAVEVLTKKYKVTNKDINSYYVTKMKKPPSWSKTMTKSFTQGSHTFGYVKSNDPTYTDMTTLKPKVKIAKTAIAQTKPTTQKTTTKSVMHKVEAGENLTTIAKKYYTTVDSIVKLNNLKNKNTLKIGQQLKVS